MAQQATGHVLIVDDEPDIRALLRTGLEQEGFAVLEASNGSEALWQLDTNPIDLVALDLKLGDEDGLTIAQDLKVRRNTPIVMITGKGDPIDRVVGLELGADDYIAKPFLVREVVARIKAVLRRCMSGRGDKLQNADETGCSGLCFEGWTMDLVRREVRTPSGSLCELTTSEFNLLSILVSRPGRVLSRDELMDLLKGHDWTPMDRSIDALVARLRKKIEPECETPHMIKTVRGVGYVFAGSARRL